MAKLTTKQQRFIEEYCSNGFNGTQAAISAGYSEKTAYSIANENLTKPEIKEEIDKYKAKLAQEAEITAMDLVRELEVAQRIAEENGQPGAYVSATMGKAKLLGLEKNITEISGRDGGPIQTQSTISFVPVGPEK